MPPASTAIATGASSNRRVARDVVVLMSLTFFGSLLSFGFQWSMARMLEPGQYATMFSLLAMLAILAVPSHVVTIVATRMASHIRGLMFK